MLSALIATLMVLPHYEITRGEWLSDFQEAKKMAQATDRTLVLNYTGSDWCPYCLRLKREVFETDQFLDWAEEKAVLVEVDFPRKKRLPEKVAKQNDWLASEYSVSSYPSVLFLNGKGELLGRSGYLGEGGPQPWIEYAENEIQKGQALLANSDGYPTIYDKRMVMKDFRGQAMPTWDLGKPVNGEMPDLKGKTVILDFWATWCSPCLEEVPKLVKWNDELGDDFVVIGITDEPPAKVKRFISRYGMTYPVLTDETRQIQSVFELQSLPAMVLISPDGVVRWQGQKGDGDPLTSMKIKRMIEATK